MRNSNSPDLRQYKLFGKLSLLQVMALIASIGIVLTLLHEFLQVYANL